MLEPHIQTAAWYLALIYEVLFKPLMGERRKYGKVDLNVRLLRGNMGKLTS
jgi:hypothetical protein